MLYFFCGYLHDTVHSSSSSSSSSGGGGGGDCTEEDGPQPIAASPANADAVAHAQQMVSTNPSAAYSLAVAAVEQLEGGNRRWQSKKITSEWEGLPTLLLATACRTAGASAALLGMHSEAAQHYGRAVTVLELSPPGTADVDGRPVEMELIASSVGAAEQSGKAGNHAAALQHLEHAKLYRPVNHNGGWKNSAKRVNLL